MKASPESLTKEQWRFRRQAEETVAELYCEAQPHAELTGDVGKALLEDLADVLFKHINRHPNPAGKEHTITALFRVFPTAIANAAAMHAMPEEHFKDWLSMIVQEAATVFTVIRGNGVPDCFPDFSKKPGESELFERVKAVLAKVYCVEASAIERGWKLTGEEMVGDSLDVIEAAMELERDFRLAPDSLSEEITDAWETVGDVCASVSTQLTEQG